MNRLTGKVAIVTGAGRGIGRAIAIRLAEEGAALLAADVIEDNVAQTAAQVREAGGDAKSAVVDVSVADDVAGIVSLARSVWGKIDILVNVAGIGLTKT